VKQPRLIMPKFIVKVAPNANPWIEAMKAYMTKILASDKLGAQTLALLSVAWAQKTAST
jgi:hypothetical protein